MSALRASQPPLLEPPCFSVELGEIDIRQVSASRRLGGSVRAVVDEPLAVGDLTPVAQSIRHAVVPLGLFRDDDRYRECLTNSLETLA